MALYLITQNGQVIEKTEQKSLKDAAAALIEGEYRIYTLQGEPKTVEVMSVTHTEILIGDLEQGTTQLLEEEE